MKYRKKQIMIKRKLIKAGYKLKTCFGLGNYGRIENIYFKRYKLIFEEDGFFELSEKFGIGYYSRVSGFLNENEDWKNFLYYLRKVLKI